MTAAVVLLASFALALLVAVGPRTGTYRTLTVLSASMEPAFGPGSVVLVRPVPVGGLTIGDVITYNVPIEDRRVVTHRIVEIERGGGHTLVRTRGDANRAVDPWTLELTGDVAWRMDRSIPWLGYGIGALREPIVSRLLTVMGPGLLGVMLLVQVWRRPAHDEEQIAPEVVPPGRPSARELASPAIHTLVLTARVASRVGRWTDDVVSGRRWLRSSAGHA